MRNYFVGLNDAIYISFDALKITYQRFWWCLDSFYEWLSRFLNNRPAIFKSSLSTLVTTACLMFIILIERATFLVRPSQQFWSSGFTPQNPQERVHTFPNIIKVPSPSILPCLAATS
jgi:hypothetical protein